MVVKVEELSLGDKVNYSMYTGVTYKGVDGGEVVMEDKNGNEKRVFVSMFEKYGTKV